MQPVLTLNNISATDNLGKIVLNKLNLSMQSGSIYMILDGSGYALGKDALLGILSGLYSYQGQIYINGLIKELETPKKRLKPEFQY